MKEIFIIGTIHLNFTPKEELEAVLNDLSPDKLFIELAPSELTKPRAESNRDEMFVALDWADANNIPYEIFDVEYSGLKEGVTGKEPEFVEEEQMCKEMLKNCSWKDLNRVEPWQISEVAELEKKIFDKYFDKEKSDQRENQMLKNIKPNLIEGRNVIITGAGHLDFFKKHLPEATLPFRK